MAGPNQRLSAHFRKIQLKLRGALQFATCYTTVKSDKHKKVALKFCKRMTRETKDELTKSKGNKGTLNITIPDTFLLSYLLL